MNVEVSASDFALIASIATPSKAERAASMSAMEITCGVPERMRSLPVAGTYAGIKVKRRLVREPSVDRVGDIEIGSDVDEGRRAWASIEILVTTAHSHLHFVEREFNWHRAGRVRQVPDRHRPDFMGTCSDGFEVMSPSAAEIDLGQRHDARSQRSMICSGSTIRSRRPNNSATEPST